MSEPVQTHPLLSTSSNNTNDDKLTHSHPTTSANTNSVNLSQPLNYFTTYPTRRSTASTPTRQAISYSTFSTPTAVLNPQSTPLATDALLFQSLRADAQALGLESDSLGWAILRFLASPSARPTRALIRRLATSPSVVLLLVLPQAKQASATTETVYDHLLLTASPDSGTTLCSTLSGWRGMIEGDRLLVCSPGPPLRSSSSTDLDPSALVPTNKPSTSLSSELTAPSRLRLPLFAFTSSPQTLTLPGLPASRTSSSSTTQRLASLFGPKPEDSPQSDPIDDPLSLPIRVLQAPGPSLASAALDLALRDALKHRIRDGLDSLDESVLSTIDSFLDRLSRDPPQGTSSLYLAPPGELAEALQTLYETIEVEVAKEYEEPVIVDHTLELLEEVLCVELYDRLYASIIDEDLGETIDRLGLADLSLDQLGFDLERREMDEPERIAALRMGLDQIISAATTELSRLEDGDCRSPRDKLSVCIRVHKLIVDGLSALPPIPIKRDGPGSGREAGALEMMAPIATGPATRIPSSALPTPTPLRPHDPAQASAADLLDALHTELISTAPEPDPVPEPETAAPPPTIPAPEKPTPTSKSSSISSADMILPMLILLLIRSKPSTLPSHLAYIRSHRFHRLLIGEADYCLVNFEVALAFIRGRETQKEEGQKKVESIGSARRAVSEIYSRVLSGSSPDVRKIAGDGQRWGSLLREGTGRLFSKEEGPSLKPGLLSSFRRNTQGSRELERSVVEGVRASTVLFEDEESRGPIERFERCESVEDLVLGDVRILVRDYQRLARLGRRAGIWK